MNLLSLLFVSSLVPLLGAAAALPAIEAQELQDKGKAP